LATAKTEIVRNFFTELVKGKPEPGVLPRPVLDKNFESNVKGLYIIGDLAGAPLIKTAAEQGTSVINHLASQVNGRMDDHEIYDVVIAGAGAAGLSAAFAAHEKGLKYTLLEQGEVANTIGIFPRDKVIYGEPVTQPMSGPLWLPAKSTKEDLLEKWNGQVQETGLNLRGRESLKKIEKNGVFTVHTDKGKYRAKNVAIAIGKFGNPRRLNVPGENKKKVSNYLSNPEEFRGKKIVVVGGGNVAAEAVLALFEHNQVTMLVWENEFIFPNKEYVERMLQAQQQGKLAIHFNAVTKEITDDKVIFERGGQRMEVANDHVFVMIGQELPTKFFKEAGIKLEAQWDVSRWLMLALSFVIVYSVYAIKGYFWPFTLLPQESYQLWGVSPSFWYGTIYTLLMLGFGIPAMIKWGKNNKYQRYRFLSLISVQVVLLYALPELIYHLVFNDPNYWRWYGLTFAWPLFFNTFFDNPPLFFVIWGIFLAFVALPIFVRYHGKRYCTWICSCGGLAETFGDRWRHLAPKGVRARRWEIMNWPILIASAGITLLIVLDVKNFLVEPWKLKNWYSLFADTWLVGIIAITLYPFFGGKVWCRYWCPLAKYMELLSHWFGKLKITSNDKCIQCGECSRYCEVGINVMQFARNQQEFSNKNTSCIQCGICIAVCPMEVLKFGSS
jgi:thioredoxin reductase/Pyruvate/2-oxoacid:ferredoxin oxidoreductase delta subunit